MKKILIHKEGKRSYCADPVWKGGSPTVGRGNTPLEALMDILPSLGFEVQVDKTGRDRYEILQDQA